MINNYTGWRVPNNHHLLDVIDLSDDKWPWNAHTSSGDGDDVDGITTADRTDGSGGGSSTQHLSVHDRKVLMQQHVFEHFVRLRKPAHLRATKNVHWLATSAVDTETVNNPSPLLNLLDMSALQSWSSPNYATILSELAGTVQVDVEVRSSSKESFGKGKLVSMSFQQFLDRVGDANDDSLYLTASSKSESSDIDNGTTQSHNAVGKRKRATSANDNTKAKESFLSPLVSALNQNGEQFPLLPHIMGSLIPSSIYIWMGRSGTRYSSSGLHHDFHDNLYILLRGSKRFRLYAPSDAEYMYLHGNVRKIHGNGLINHCLESDKDDEGGDTTSDGVPIPTISQAKLKRLQRRKELMQRKKEVEQCLMKAEENADAGVEFAQDRLQEAERELDDIMDEFMDLDEQKDTDDNVGVKSKQPSSDNNAATPTYPKSFSKIPVELLLSEQTTEANGHDELLERYPLFQNARVAYCNLMEGDALYLPTSWFHEVSSSSQANEIDKGAHLALNYWFHPPSNPQSFRSPYSSDFWPKHWREKCVD